MYIYIYYIYIYITLCNAIMKTMCPPCSQSHCGDNREGTLFL